MTPAKSTFLVADFALPSLDYTGPFTLDVLSEGFAKIEKEKLLVAEVVCSAKHFAELQASDKPGRDGKFNITSVGCQNSIWGAAITLWDQDWVELWSEPKSSGVRLRQALVSRDGLDPL